MIDNDAPELQRSKAFTSIVKKCEWIARHIFKKPAGLGINLALDGTLCTWSLDAQDPAETVRLLAQCEHCGRQWWRRAIHQVTWRCPVCSAYLGLDLAGSDRPRIRRVGTYP